MDNLKNSAKKTGLVLGIFLVIFGLVYRYGELDRLPALGWIFYLAIPFFMYRWYGAVDRTSLDFKSTFKWTVLLSLIGNGIYTVFVYVFNKFIDDSLLQKTYQQGVKRLEDKGTTGEALELAQKQLELFTTVELFSVIIFIQLILFSLFCGVIYGLIARRKNA